MKVYSHVHRDSPGNGRGAWKSVATYRSIDPRDGLIETYSDTSGRDRYDDHFERFLSPDARSWGESRLIIPTRQDGDTVTRGSETFLDTDAGTGRVFRVYNEAVFHHDWRDDSVEDSHLHTTLYVQYSLDGGLSFLPRLDLSAVARSSATFRSTAPGISLHPLISCSHLETLDDGALLIPVMRWAGSDAGDGRRIGDAGYSICAGCMAIGRWKPDLGGIDFHFGRPIPHPTDHRTSGISEVSIAKWNNQLLAVARMEPFDGAVHPSCKWWSISRDQGETWSLAQPLRGTQGEWIYSPATCCRLFRHSSGRLLLITNLYDHPCQGLGPRYALHIAEIAPDAHGNPAIVKKSIAAIDQRRDGEHRELALSNFAVYEDKLTGELCVFCPRVYASRFDLEDSVCMLYRIRI